ncbi:hypothetical protein ACLB2K_032502 [Fragaria x ananassa]
MTSKEIFEEFLSGFLNCRDNGEMVSEMQHLHLPFNSLSLKTLDLSSNRMNGSIIPHFLGHVSQLVELHLFGNSWEGILTEAHFVNLTRLEQFQISTDIPPLSSSLIFIVTYDYLPPFNLSRVYIQNCRVGPGFPVWLRSQTQLVDVLLDNTGISGRIPDEGS